MASNYFKIKKGLNLEPLASSVSAAGDFSYNSSTGKFEGYSGAVDSFVQEAKAATLTNKVLTGNTAVNLVSGSGILVLNTSGTITVPNATDTLVGKATSDTLTNKILTGNTAVNLISGSGTTVFNTTGTITLPNTTDTLVGLATSDTLTNKVLSGNTAVTLISGSGVLTLNTSGNVTLPNTTDTLVGKATTDTLTNKTLTAPIIATIVNSGTLTLPTSSDTLVGRATTDTLTNKTLTGNTAVNLVSGSGTVVINTSGTVTLPNATDTLVGKATTDTLTNKSISGSTNTITNISLTTGVTGTLPIANGGSGQTSANNALNAFLPSQGSNSGKFLTTDGTNTSWASQSSSPTQSYELSNLGLATSVSSNAMTVALKQSDGSTDPSTGAASVKIGFRDATVTTGAYSQISSTSALSIVLPTGATLGQNSGGTAYIYVYAINNAGSIELAVSSKLFDDWSVQSTLAIFPVLGTDATIMYSAVARTNVAVRLIGRLKNSQTVAGTYAANALEVSLVASKRQSNLPTIQTLTSSSGTYTTPLGCTYLKIRAIGSGGGGGGSGTSGGGTGNTGGTTSFGTAGSVFSLAGGAGGVWADNSGNGGAVTTGTGITIVSVNGAKGSSSGNTGTSSGYVAGGAGAASAFGTGGAGSLNGNGGVSGAYGCGGGGAGSQSQSNNYGGSGGSTGAYIEVFVPNPVATYAYAVGQAAAGGGAGTNGFIGGDSRQGVIVVEEYYT